MKRLCGAWCLLGGVIAAMAGCAHPAKPVAATAPSASEVAAHNATAIELLTDPCAAQLQDIGGALAIFYHDRQGMPERLESLVPLAKKWGLQLELSCPVSHEPYVYVAAGLGVPGQTQRLVVYDATPAHNGWRWGVVMEPPPQGTTTVMPQVIHLSENDLREYLKSAVRK